jgi:hypothetical protein
MLSHFRFENKAFTIERWLSHLLGRQQLNL